MGINGYRMSVKRELHFWAKIRRFSYQAFHGTLTGQGYRFQEQDLLLMRGQERSLHESPQWAWGEQYVLGATWGCWGLQLILESGVDGGKTRANEVFQERSNIKGYGLGS